MISLQNINKFYRTGEEQLHVLKQLNLEINAGEFTAIMGPSGSGKSTLINVIGFIDRQFDGSYLFEGKKLHDRSDDEISRLRNQSVGFVFQNFSLIENNTIYENVELPLLYSGFSFKETAKQVMSVLEKVGIADKATKYPQQLSGGQQQRVAIARAIVNQPKFIIADEPTGALDSVTSKEIIKLFHSLNQFDQTTIILVTHNIETTKHCHRLINLLDGKITSVKELVT